MINAQVHVKNKPRIYAVFNYTHTFVRTYTYIHNNKKLKLTKKEVVYCKI